MRKDLGTDFTCDLCEKFYHSDNSDAIKPLDWYQIRASTQTGYHHELYLLACDKCWACDPIKAETKKNIIIKLKESFGL